MSTYAEKQLAYIQEHQDVLDKVATERLQEGQTAMSGNFIHYVDFISGQGKVTSEDVPNGKTSKTKNGGSCYIKNAEVSITNITPTDIIKLNADGTYTATIDVRVDPKTSDSVLDYMRHNAASVTKYYDAETDTIYGKIDVIIHPNRTFPLTMMVFNDGDFKPLSKKDSKTGKLQIRRGKPISLHGASFQIQLSTYSQKPRNEGDSPITVFKHDISIKCGKITLDETKAQPLGVSPCAIYETMYNKDDIVLYDMVDIHSGEKKLPQTMYIYTHASGKFETDNLIRTTAKISDINSVIQNYGNDQRENKIQAKFGCTDIYGKLEQSFSNTFTAYSEICGSTGLDVEDDDIWSDIMMAHTFTSHFVCDLSEGGTMSLVQNSTGTISARDSLPFFYHGCYVWTVKQWEIDWVDTLENRGIEITKEKFLQTFKDANSGLSGSEKKFKVVTLEDGEKEINFKSVLNGSNPIMNDGLYSKVIPFGSGSRPTIECDDASEVINHPNATFYAITGISTEDTEDWDSAEEGSEVFQRQISEQDASYQLFVIQDLGMQKIKK